MTRCVHTTHFALSWTNFINQFDIQRAKYSVNRNISIKIIGTKHSLHIFQSFGGFSFHRLHSMLDPHIVISFLSTLYLSCIFVFIARDETRHFAFKFRTPQFNGQLHMNLFLVKFCEQQFLNFFLSFFSNCFAKFASEI